MLTVKVSTNHGYDSTVFFKKKFGSVSVWYCDNIVHMVWLGLAQKKILKIELFTQVCFQTECFFAPTNSKLKFSITLTNLSID